MSRISFVHLIGKVLSVVPVHHNRNRVDLQVKGTLVTISNCDSQVRHILKLNWLLLVLDSALACHIEFGKWDLKKLKKIILFPPAVMSIWDVNCTLIISFSHA